MAMFNITYVKLFVGTDYFGCLVIPEATTNYVYINIVKCIEGK